MISGKLHFSMITKNIVKQPKSIVEVSVTVPWTDLRSSWEQTLQRMAADVEIAGFRKGAAPVAMVESQLGTRLQDEVLKTSMPNFLIEALKGTDIIPIDYPKYELTSFAKNNQLQFKAVITNRPAVTVGNYKTIKVTKSVPKPVNDEEVNKVIDDLFKRWKARNPAAVQASGNSGQASVNQTSQAGSISFQGGNQIASPHSSSVGSTPAPRNDSNSNTDVPTDEFAKAMQATSMVDLKNKIRKDLESNVAYNNELDYEESILQEVEKITTVELPDILIQDELNRMLVSLQRRVADMGLLLEDYLKGQGKTLDQIKNEWKPQAEKNVKMELGLADIARQENVTISDAELQAEVDKIQDPRVKKQFDTQEPRLHLRHALRQTRTLDLLKKIVGG